MTVIDDATHRRQMQIWTNMYGPSQAVNIMDRAKELLAAQPELPCAEAFRQADPENEEEYRDFVATRW